MRRPEAPGRGDGAAAGDGVPGASLEARARQVQALRQRRAAVDRLAREHNQAHAAECAELNRLTQDQLGSGTLIAPQRLRVWQSEHGLPPDGKVGARTLAAARGRDDAGVVSFSDEEAGAIRAAAPTPAAGLAEAVVAGGALDGLEEREPPETDELGERGAQLKETIEAALPGKLGRAASWGALVPALVELLHAGRYKEAIAYVVDSVGWEERAELIKEAAERFAERYGYRLAPRLLRICEHAVAGGGVVDVLQLSWEWTAKGLEAIDAAHAAGDRDSRIAIYAYAWSDTVMGNRHDNGGAVSPAQREAMALGVADGEATLQQSPELGALLVAEYGNGSLARRALERALLARAGLLGGAHGR